MLTENQLNYYRIDCNNIQSQVEFLQSQRVDKTDIINSWLTVPFNGFKPVYSERRNWQVNFLLQELNYKCNG